MCSRVLQEISSTLNDEVFLSSLKSDVNISLVSSKKRSGITAEDLVQNWGIGLEAAKRTVEATTQKGGEVYSQYVLIQRIRDK